MKKSKNCAILVVVAISIFSFSLAESQDNAADVEDTVLTEENIAKSITDGDLDLGLRLFGILGEQNSALEKILKGAKIKLKFFESQDEDDPASFGFEYDYSKDFAHHRFKGENRSGLTGNFGASGNVAFDRDVNPNNFLDTSFSFLWYYSIGGFKDVSDEAEKIAPDVIREWLNASVEAETLEELDNLPEWHKLSQAIRNRLTDQYYFDLSAKGGLESDQSFDNKQYYYGLHLGFVARGWNADESALAKFNILDYPAALLRILSGVDSKWRPRGSAFPEFLVGIDHVEPEDDNPRKTMANDDSSFDRVRLEASFRTLAATYKNASAFLEANFRHYEELSPSESVEDAGLDSYTYFTVALTMPSANGIYVSYTTGELPMDHKDDQVYELGFKYRL